MQDMSDANPVASVPQWDLGDRLRKSLRVAGVPVNAMAEELGLTRVTVGNYLALRTTPSRSVLRVWALKCGVPFEWLLTGECPPWDSNPEPADYPSAQIVPLTRTERSVPRPVDEDSYRPAAA